MKLHPSVQSLTGITIRETVPDSTLDRADEIVLVDLTPEALEERMKRGDIYPLERVDRALSNFFRRGNLIALREMVLQQGTRAVDRNLDAYVTRKRLGGEWCVREKVAVCISTSPHAKQLIAPGARIAEGLGAEFFVLYVNGGEAPSEDRKLSLAANIRLAENLGAKVVELENNSVSRATSEFVARERVTQVIFGRSAVTGLKKYLYYLAIHRFMTGRATCRSAHRHPGTSVMRRSILLVDDEPQIARVLQLMLESSGYEVTVARDGIEALEKFTRSKPDLVITDLSMPVMDGIELTRTIRRQGNTPVIVLSVKTLKR